MRGSTFYQETETRQKDEADKGEKRGWDFRDPVRLSGIFAV